ncbi:3-carboxy-cis,cis-muconate cycloisomerase [Roseibium polysiphoniae]|uniref:3-carboxy-cis,cis-muconate cycloisomerase n=1 Tax=Roseibium polysiphoniae TaxID=2571221 RepID=A0A944C8K9_9HYPH|nr:3-carboxy-cis,cis-muconate cycloisomerase [Roseibium polysiphoniae]MBS8259185.1 3-carboxy-cis,cis-muconate cycloisomerase [Roseibium polysiphoniae]
MGPTAFDSQITGALLTAPETAALFEDKAVIKAMLEVEGGLALAEADCGLIPTESAKAIAATCQSLLVDPISLAEGTAKDGVAVPALVAQLRAAVGSQHASFVHWGATSQDICDTGLILRLRTAIDLHTASLRRLAGQLAKLADAHRNTPIAARTRMQQATPTSFGLKAAVWLSGLLRHLERLDGIKSRLLLLSFGGAAGNLSALGEHAVAVETNLAARLNLGVSPAPWHTLRDGLYDYAGWLSLVSGTLGKIGTDIVLLAQNEIAEVRPGGGGGSSTMPNKVNPIGGEVLVAIARQNAGLLGTLHQAALQEHERSGANWTLEWLTLPQIVLSTGSALDHANRLLGALEVKGETMRATIETSNGLLLAEAASFALAEHMPRPEAQALVKNACKQVNETGTHLFDVLAGLSEAPIDWEDLKDPAHHMGASDVMIDRVLESYQHLDVKR